MEEELIKVLSYSKFGLTSDEILPIVNNLRRHVLFVEVKSRVDAIIEDPTDNVFLECALDGKADYIISGDHHLLNLNSFQGISIAKVKYFLIKEGFSLP